MIDWLQCLLYTGPRVPSDYCNIFCWLVDRPPDAEGKAVDGKVTDNSESESENSQKSQTGKDFEMVEREEVES